MCKYRPGMASGDLLDSAPPIFAPRLSNPGVASARCFVAPPPSQVDMMNTLRVTCLVTMTVLLIGGLSSTAAGQSPLDRLLFSSSVENDPAKPYLLAEANGPWLIKVCSFSGEGDEDEAQVLVHELRGRYKLRAYMYVKQFELEKTFQTLGIYSSGTPKIGRYRQSKIREVAVLIGDYMDSDDPDAQRVLERLKFNIYPECMELKKGQRTTRVLGGLREMQHRVHVDKDNAKKERGPLGRAMMTTNPLIPQEYFNQTAGIDKLVIDMNEGVEHNLLDCPGKYTVQVAHFTGRTTMNQAEIQSTNIGRTAHGSQLAEAAIKAHTLTMALREKGYEAYEFHDKKASLVTVGSFNSVGTPRADGKTEINPAIHAIMKRFGVETNVAMGQSTPFDQVHQKPENWSTLGAVRTLGSKPKTLLGITFDLQPQPVYVPRRPASATLNRNRFLGMR